MASRFDTFIGMVASSVRLAWVLAGGASLVIGVVGIILPLLPTTPFLLLAGFCFSKSSERLHRWLISHRYLGEPVRDWKEHGVISRRAKLVAFVTLGTTVLYVFYALPFSTLVQVSVSLFLIAILTYILTRPSLRG